MSTKEERELKKKVNSLKKVYGKSRTKVQRDINALNKELRRFSPLSQGQQREQKIIRTVFDYPPTQWESFLRFPATKEALQRDYTYLLKKEIRYAISRNSNYIGFVIGITGTGKSEIAQSLALYHKAIYRKMHPDRRCRIWLSFNQSDTMGKLRNAQKGDLIIQDESTEFSGAGSRTLGTNFNNIIRTIRAKEISFLICSPDVPTGIVVCHFKLESAGLGSGRLNRAVIYDSMQHALGVVYIKMHNDEVFRQKYVQRKIANIDRLQYGEGEEKIRARREIVEHVIQSVQERILQIEHQQGTRVEISSRRNIENIIDSLGIGMDTATYKVTIDILDYHYLQDLPLSAALAAYFSEVEDGDLDSPIEDSGMSDKHIIPAVTDKEKMIEKLPLVLPSNFKAMNISEIDTLLPSVGQYSLEAETIISGSTTTDHLIIRDVLDLIKNIGEEKRIKHTPTIQTVRTFWNEGDGRTSEVARHIGKSTVTVNSNLDSFYTNVVPYATFGEYIERSLWKNVFVPSFIKICQKRGILQNNTNGLGYYVVKLVPDRQKGKAATTSYKLISLPLHIDKINWKRNMGIVIADREAFKEFKKPQRKNMSPTYPIFNIKYNFNLGEIILEDSNIYSGIFWYGGAGMIDFWLFNNQHSIGVDSKVYTRGVKVSTNKGYKKYYYPIEYRDLQPLARGFQSLLFTRGVVIGVQPYFPTATVNIDPQTDFSKGNFLIETNDNASRHVLASRWAYNILREILPNAKT